MQVKKPLPAIGGSKKQFPIIEIQHQRLGEWGAGSRARSVQASIGQVLCVASRCGNEGRYIPHSFF